MSETPRLFPVEQTEYTSDDYYTPAWIFEALGLQFDLDVAAPPGGISWIPADRYFTQADDGLAQPWHGLVWMNPPYSAPSAWVRRFLEHGNGVALTPFAKSRWFDELVNSSAALRPLPYSHKFTRPDDASGSIFMPCALWAIGPAAITALRNLGPLRILESTPT